MDSPQSTLQPLALSTCWNAERHSEGKELIDEILALGFSHVEIGHNTRFSLWPGIVQAVNSNMIKVVSLHNFCPLPVEILRPSPNCYTFTDPSPSTRQRAVQSTLETLEHAAEVNAKRVVLHLGAAGKNELTREMEEWFEEGSLFCKEYLEAKREAVIQRRQLWNTLWSRVKSCLDPVVAKATELNIQLGIEARNAFEEFPNQEEFQKVLDAYPDSSVGFWHDFGHASRQEYLGWQDHEELLATYRSRIIGAHVQDCLPPNDDHLAIGRGHLNFSQLLPYIPKDATCVLEVDPSTTPEDLIESRNLWNEYAATAAS